MNSCDDNNRAPNNTKQKRLYGRVFYSLNFGPLEEDKRWRLPTCQEARICRIFSDVTSYYMGYYEGWNYWLFNINKVRYTAAILILVMLWLSFS